MLSGQLSTGPLCATAMKPLADLLSKIIRDVSKGIDPLGETFTVNCPDPGIDNGGLGTVTFKARIEPGN